MFDAVNRCDLAFCMDKGRPEAMYVEHRNIPRSFPYVNGGVVVMRRNWRSLRLIREWQEMVLSNGLASDQPALRWLLYHRKVRFQILPQEYNLINYELLANWKRYYGAPRLLHLPPLHKADPGNATEPLDVSTVLNPETAALLTRLHRQEKAQLTKYRKNPEVLTGKPVRRLLRLRFLADAMLLHLASTLKGFSSADFRAKFA